MSLETRRVDSPPARRPSARVEPARRPSARLKVALLLGSIAMAGLVAEVSARAWLAFFASKQEFSKYATFAEIQASRPVLYVRHQYLPYVPKPGYSDGLNRHNALGYRGEEVALPKPAGTFRIVAVGGSTTYDSEIPDFRQAYPAQLQQALRERGHDRVEVINAGVPKYTSWEDLINLQFRVLDLDPDLVILYPNINDVHPRLVSPHDLYRGDNSGGLAPYEPPRESWLDRLAISRIVRTKLGLRNPNLMSLGYLAMYEALPHNHAGAFREQRYRKTYPAGPFADEAAGEMLRRNPPIFLERNLRNMLAACQAHGVGVMTMTFASSPLFPAHLAVVSDEYQAAFREQNEVVRRVSAERGVPCLDLAATFPTDPAYWADGQHNNPAGAALKARMAADFLEAVDVIRPAG